MTSRESARGALRAATSAYHDRVDALFSRIDPASDEGYRHFLLAQASAHLPVEEALTRAGAAAILPDWPARQRAPALRADLDALALPVPAAAAPVRFEGAAEILGGIYVLEGSRLGGRLIRRSLPAHLPASFLGDADPTAWRRLLAVLEERLTTDDRRAAAVGAAIAVFRVFETAAARRASA